MKTIFLQYKYIPVSIAQCFGRGMFLNEMKNSGTLIITLVIILLFKLCGCCQMIQLTLSQELLGNYPHPDEQ